MSYMSKQPQGAGFMVPRSLANSPPNTPNKLGGSQGKLNQNNKLIALKIVLLDDSVTIIQAQSKALGRVVFDQVCKQLNILEADYFGLEYSAVSSLAFPYHANLYLPT